MKNLLSMICIFTIILSNVERIKITNNEMVDKIN